jgi:hypothetical protein
MTADENSHPGHERHHRCFILNRGRMMEKTML